MRFTTASRPDTRRYCSPGVWGMMAAAVGSAGLCADFAAAGFDGPAFVIEKVSSPDLPDDLWTLRISLLFVDEVEVIGIHCADLSLTSPSTTMFQSSPPFGGDLPPDPSFVPFEPTLPWDSWVTLGGDTSQETEDIVLGETFDSAAFNGGGRIAGAWFDSDLSSPVVLDESGQVLILQMTVPFATSVHGWLTVEYRQPDGAIVFEDLLIHPFLTPPLRCEDQNDDGHVNAADLAALLGAWGEVTAAACNARADLNNDQVVNAADLAQLLGAWGECVYF